MPHTMFDIMIQSLLNTRVTLGDEVWLFVLVLTSNDAMACGKIWSAIATYPANFAIDTDDLTHSAVVQLKGVSQETSRNLDDAHLRLGILLHMPSGGVILMLDDPNA